MRRLRVRLIWHLPLRLLRLRAGQLAGLVFAAAAATPMPMRLHLTIVRSWPLFRLGLGWFYCHDAYTSWYFALCAIHCAIYNRFNRSMTLFGDPVWRPCANAPRNLMKSDAEDTVNRSLLKLARFLPEIGATLFIHAKTRSARGTKTGRHDSNFCGYHPMSIFENAIAASTA
jgi:hypothetical protein